jgi:peptide/nickel transport system substrate-binding protein
MHRRSFLQAAASVAALSTSSFISHRARAQGKNVLRMGFADEVLTLDPIKTVYGPDILIQGIMFARLMRASGDRKELFPALAESHQISDDGLTYTFKLRDAKFSDGSPITAEDVAFSYTRMRFQKDSAYAGPFTALEKTEAADGNTVVMHLNKTFTPFIQNVEIWNSGIVSKAAVEKMGDEQFAQTPVSSGPFRLVEWKKGDRVILEKNPHYYRAGLPYLDGLEIIYVPDDNTRVSMLRAGEIDMLIGAPYQLVSQLAAEGFQAEPEPASIIYEMLLNHRPAVQRVRVRQRSATASIARPSAMRSLGLGKPAGSLMAPVLNYFNTICLSSARRPVRLLACFRKPTSL